MCINSEIVKWKSWKITFYDWILICIEHPFFTYQSKYFFLSLTRELQMYNGVFTHDQTMKFERVLNSLGLKKAFLGILPWQQGGIFFFRFISQERNAYFNVPTGAVSYFPLYTMGEMIAVCLRVYVTTFSFLVNTPNINIPDFK